MNRIPSEDGLNIVDKGRLVGKFQENKDYPFTTFDERIRVVL